MGRSQWNYSIVDPWPYEGPLRRVDGIAPFNHFLWPLDQDWFWANQDLDPQRRYSSRWNFYVVALADGRWLSDGTVREDESGMRIFATREAALRHAAACLLRMIRAARHWPSHLVDHVSPEDYVALVGWIFNRLNQPPPPVYILPPPPPPARNVPQQMELFA